MPRKMKLFYIASELVVDDEQAKIVTAAVTMLGNKYEDTYKETQSMTAVTAEQQKELESLEEQYQIACDTYGDTSDQASSLKYRIDTLSESLNSNGQSVGDLISECDNLIDKHNSLMDELDNNTESVHKNKLENLALIARLSELASSTGEAAGKQQEMQAILDELNGSIDGLNMTYEDLTENQDKSLAYIKQMAQEQAKQEAYNEKYREDGGDVGTYHYDITLKEYQEVSLKTVTIDSSLVATVQDTVARVDSTSTPKTYTVKKGDCLYNIAKSLYGDGSKYSSIYAANKSLIGSNPNLIKPGQVLQIP